MLPRMATRSSTHESGPRARADLADPPADAATGPPAERIARPDTGTDAQRSSAPAAARRTTGGRARPMPAEERRAALIEATLPLVAEHGLAVTTRQIADAAGVAEGTIFRVFPDKDALVRAAVEAALDPLPVIAELDAVDPDLPVEQRVHAITEILQRRLTRVFRLMLAIRMHHPPDHRPGEPPRHDPAAANEQVLRAVRRLLEPDEHLFRVPVAEVARTMRLLTFAGTHPLITDHHPMTSQEITIVLLDGLRRHPD
jgi:AcrR family transcriptional regulator